MDTVQVADSTVIYVAGQIDSCSANQLREELTACLDRCPRQLLVDLSGVRFMDCSGVAALLAVNRASRCHARPIVLVASPPCVLHLLRLLALDQTFSQAPTIEHGLAQPVDDQANTKTADNTR